MKTEMVSARFEKKDTALIEQVAKDEKTDKTTALKRIFGIGAKQYKIERAIKQYQEGKLSIGKAAENAEIGIWEMMEELKERNIANPLSEEEFKEGLKNLEKVWK
ncbi:MAG: UPF0175 family protein [Candidatus Diapherotrites archaeon]